MRIAVATLVVGDDYSRVVQPATQSKIDYCNIHGYDPIIGLTSDSTRPVPWSKIPLLHRVLPEYDFVFFSDADTLVADYDRRIENTFLEPLGTDKHISIADRKSV